MINDKNLYYQHRGKSVTVLELLSDHSSIFYNQREPITVNEFLSFTDNKGVSNKESIFSSYVTNDERRKRGEGGYLKIKPNTKLVLPKKRGTKTKSNPQKLVPKTSTLDISFKSSVLSSLQKEPGYRFLHPQYDNKEQGGVLTQRFPKLSVWLWSRELGETNREEGWFDLSPFISSIDTNVGSNGGNFSLSLPPLSCKFENGVWTLSKEELTYYTQTTNHIHYLSQVNFFIKDTQTSGEYIPTSSSVKFLKRNKFLFMNIISPNDMIFVKYDTLELESNSRVLDSTRKPLSSNLLPGQVYDFIGLVDQSSFATSVSDSQLSVSIEVKGRSLIKPLIEDGTYFFPTEYVNGGYKKLYFSSGSIAQLSIPLFRKIKDIIEFFIKNLSNIRVVPDGVLDSYPKKGKGVWNIINLLVDKSVEKRVVVDSSISVSQGSLISHFRKICQEPFVEFFSDTYFDQYYLTIRTPPWTQSAIANVLKGQFKDESGSIQFLDLPYISINENSVIQEELTFSDEQSYTWFSLTPKEIVGGIAQDSWASIFPPKVFPELVEIFGSKPLKLTHNYLSYSTDLENEQQKVVKTVKEQTLEDLKFLIETHVHLPFTRSGTITIVGDRRIKRGEYLFYSPTNELFYIESVKHSYSIGSNIQSTTVISVSRGMVVDYILGKNVPGYSKKISYFNIVNLQGVEAYRQVEEKKILFEDKVKKIKRKVTGLTDQIDFQNKNLDLSRLKLKSNRVDISNTNQRLLSYLLNLPDYLLDSVLITSGNDQNHMEGSKHFEGNALDLRYNKELYNYIQNDINREIYGIEPLPPSNHGTAPHLHLEVYDNLINSDLEQTIPGSEVYEEVEEVETVQTEILTGNKISVLDISTSLENIYVNKEVLSFFLKKQQFS